MRAKRHLLFVFLSILLMTSCGVPKDIAYFQGIDDVDSLRTTAVDGDFSIRFKPDDQLVITVTAWDPSTVAMFNPSNYEKLEFKDSKGRSTEQPLYSYTVDSEGFINFPVLGRVFVGNKTKRETEDFLNKEICKYVEDALVNVQISNFQVTIGGEVTRPDRYRIASDRITILDVIGMAGDLTINGDRKNVLLIRDDGGELKRYRIDFTSPDLFKSPAFYLQQNDYIYVEPNNTQKRNSRYDMIKQQNIGFLASLVTTASVIISILVNTKVVK